MKENNIKNKNEFEPILENKKMNLLEKYRIWIINIVISVIIEVIELLLLQQSRDRILLKNFKPRIRYNFFGYKKIEWEMRDIPLTDDETDQQMKDFIEIKKYL